MKQCGCSAVLLAAHTNGRAGGRNACCSHRSRSGFFNAHTNPLLWSLIFECLPTGFLAQLRIQGLACSRCSLKTGSMNGWAAGLVLTWEALPLNFLFFQENTGSCLPKATVRWRSKPRTGTGQALFGEESRHPPSHSDSWDDREGERTFRSWGSDVTPDRAGRAIHSPGRVSPPARPAPPLKEKPQTSRVNLFRHPQPESSRRFCVSLCAMMTGSEERPLKCVLHPSARPRGCLVCGVGST